MGLSIMAQDFVKREDIYLSLLNKLYTTNILTSSEVTSVARDLCSTCNRTKQIKKIFYTFETLGVNILPDIMIHKLRFKSIIAIANVKKTRRCPSLASIASGTPYIKSITISYPKKIIICIYAPSNINDNSLRSYDDIDLYVYNYIIRSKPLPEYLFKMLEGSSDIVDGEIFSKCIENPLTLPEDWDHKPRITSLALYILDALSINPTLTIDETVAEVSKRIGKNLTWQKIKKHIHGASKFIYGYRIAVIKAPHISDVKMGLIIEGINDPARFCLSFIRHPLSIGCSWNDNNYVLIFSSLPEIGLARFKENIYWFIDQLGGEVVDIFEYIVKQDNIAIVNIPYREWSPLLKSWRDFEDPIQSVIEKLRQSNCIEI